MAHLTKRIATDEPGAPARTPADATRTQSAPGGRDARPRVLYIHPGTFGPPIDPRRNPFHFLSRHLRGDYVTTWVADDPAAAEGWAEQCKEALGDFRFRWTRSLHLPPGVQQLWDMAFFVATGLRLSREQGRFDAVIAYGPHRTGLAGYLIARLTGAVFILELPGHPLKPYRFVRGLVPRIKQGISPRIVSMLLRRADHVRLLYPAQLPAAARRDAAHTSVFHNFVAIGAIEAAAPEPGAASPYILFLGYPWFLKGVDVLIRAFLRIADRFPDYTLRIVGHCPDRSEFEALRGGCDRIRFERAVPHPQAIRLMEQCSLFVLPSRTEAMGRVLLEAMAAAKPIIASAVDGIPHYIEHGRNGLLFRSEDDADLAAQMERVLADPAFARALALRGHAYVHDRLSEEQYALRFREMVDRAIATSRAGAA